MSKRTDIHCPSAILPKNYEFVSYGHTKIEEFGEVGFIAQQREVFEAHRKLTDATFSGHDHGGNCDVCGAHCVLDAIFYHVPTNQYIRTGLDCAEKMFSLDSSRFRTNCRNALKNNAGKRKALATLEAVGASFGLIAFTVYTNTADQSYEASTIRDIVGKLVKYGSTSDKAMDYLKLLVDRISRRPEIEAARKAEKAAAGPLPVTEERIEVTGKVLSVKEKDGFYGLEIKILVQHEDGWKVYGNAPTSIRNEVTRGDTVTFKARVEASQDDPKFGFFKRPTGCKITEVCE